MPAKSETYSNEAIQAFNKSGKYDAMIAVMLSTLRYSAWNDDCIGMEISITQSMLKALEPELYEKKKNEILEQYKKEEEKNE